MLSSDEDTSLMQALLVRLRLRLRLRLGLG